MEKPSCKASEMFVAVEMKGCLPKDLTASHKRRIDDTLTIVSLVKIASMTR